MRASKFLRHIFTGVPLALCFALGVALSADAQVSTSCPTDSYTPVSLNFTTPPIVQFDAAGQTQLYSNVGTTAGGQDIDARVTIVSLANTNGSSDFLLEAGPNSISGVGLETLVHPTNGTQNSVATFQMAFFEAGTTTPIAIDFATSVSDIDARTQEAEFAQVNTANLSAYRVVSNTDLQITLFAGGIEAQGGTDGNADPQNTIVWVFDDATEVVFTVGRYAFQSSTTIRGVFFEFDQDEINAITSVNCPATTNDAPIVGNPFDTTTTGGATGTFLEVQLGVDFDGTIASVVAGSCSNGGSLSANGTAIDYTMPASGQTSTCAYTVVDDDGAMTSGTITLAAPVSPDSDGDGDPDVTDPNDSNPCITSVPAPGTAFQQANCADLSVTKTSVEPAVDCQAGETQWSIIIANAGPANATNVVATDTPTNATIVSSSGDTDCMSAPGCSIPNAGTKTITTCTVPN